MPLCHFIYKIIVTNSKPGSIKTHTANTPYMKTLTHTLFAFLFMALVIPGFSQNSTAKPDKKSEPVVKEKASTDGLKKISSGSARDWDFDIHIDHAALAKNIEAAVENAMRSAEGALERLEINIDPIEINLKDLDVLTNPIVVNIPNMNFDIEPIEVNVPNIDVDVDVDMDDDHSRCFGGTWRTALHAARRTGGRHQSENADPDVAANGTRRACDADNTPRHSAQSGIQVDRPRLEPGRSILRRMGLGREESFSRRKSTS